MSKSAALDTGELVEDKHDDKCTSYRLTGGGRIVISQRLGVVRITPPRHVRLGNFTAGNTTVAQLKAAFPVGLQEFRNGFTMEASELIRSSYAFISSAPGNPYQATDPIDTFRVELNSYDCSLALT